MRPTNYNGMPHWERDFWSMLLSEQGVPETPVNQPYVSPYAGEDVLVGEIVEDDRMEIEA